MLGGIIGQSLREIAAAIGTSHRMLLYHFQSREGLLVAICNMLNESVVGGLGQWKEPRELWAHFADPEAWPFERLFFELYAHALFRRPGSEGFVSGPESTRPVLASRRVSTSPLPEDCCSICSPPRRARKSTRPTTTTCNSLAKAQAVSPGTPA